MWHGIVKIGVLFIMARLTPLACLSQLSLAKMSKVVANIEKRKETNLNVCDENDNTGNWDIYCSGQIIAAMNLHQVDADSKTFVDRPLKEDSEVILQEFKKEFGGIPLKDINVRKLIDFRKRFFGEPGTELNSCFISEWREVPWKIARIKDKTLKLFALFLNRKWKDLCRQNVKIENPKRNSLIEVPHPFIVSGGRFREFFYWDAYWIVKVFYFRFGFVPNAGRVYYLRTSNPPFLIPMVYEYYKATEDVAFLKKNFEHLVKEYEFWVNNRSVKVKDKMGYEHNVYQYRTMTNVPRPDSYRADVRAAVKVEEKKQQKFFQDIASAAESGWDFSSRWFSDRKTMKTIETTNILPVDLNALLCWNANLLKYFADIIGNKEKAKEFEEKAKNATKALNAIFYNDVEKAWFDYNLRTKSHNTLFYPTVAIPLFTGCYETLDYSKSVKVIEFMKRSRVLDYPSGIPSSVSKSGQQWDLPYGWPPMQHMIIEGMRKSGDYEAQQLAFKLARKWVMANYIMYQKTKKIQDKIDVTGSISKAEVRGKHVQNGYAWTYGIILDLLVTYYDQMFIQDTDQIMSPGSRPCRSKAYRIDYVTIKLIMLSVTISYFFNY
uniref:Trehalase n=1 Tax=Elaeophora elaphi TaxID=1147741 RepID=A0A0R3RLU0_9BILA